MKNKKALIGIIVFVIVILAGVAAYAATKGKKAKDKKPKGGTGVPVLNIANQGKIYNPTTGKGLELIRQRAEVLASNQDYVDNKIYDIKAFLPSKMGKTAMGVYADKMADDWGSDMFPYVYSGLDNGSQLKALKAAKSLNPHSKWEASSGLFGQSVKHFNNYDEVRDANGNLLRISIDKYGYYGGKYTAEGEAGYRRETVLIAQRLFDESKRVGNEIEAEALQQLVASGLLFTGINA